MKLAYLELFEIEDVKNRILPIDKLNFLSEQEKKRYEKKIYNKETETWDYKNVFIKKCKKNNAKFTEDGSCFFSNFIENKDDENKKLIECKAKFFAYFTIFQMEELKKITQIYILRNLDYDFEEYGEYIINGDFYKIKPIYDYLRKRKRFFYEGGGDVYTTLLGSKVHIL